jgi:serine O-acetyltransferase
MVRLGDRASNWFAPLRRHVKLSLPPADLSRYVARQVSTMFPDRDVAASDVERHVARALERLEHCFSRIAIKYFWDGEHTRFSHLHTDQYAMFLYFLSNTVHAAGGDPSVAGKVYALNKALHGIDVFYEVELPSVFAFQHPVGTVLGRGRYSDYFLVYQRCSIGSDLEGRYPVIGEGVVMFGGSSVIGNAHVGANAWLSVGTTILGQDVPAGSVVFGRSPSLVVKPTSRVVVRDIFMKDRPAAPSQRPAP